MKKKKDKVLGNKGILPLLGLLFTPIGLITLAITLLVIIFFSWFLVQNLLLLVGGALIVLSIIYLKHVNVPIIMLGAVLMLIPFTTDKLEDFNLLQVIPSQQGASIVQPDWKPFFEQGDSSEGVKIVGAIPTRRGTGGGISGYKLYFDDQLVSCKSSSYGEWSYCICNEGDYRQTGNTKNQLVDCEGYSSGGDCVGYCQNKPLEIKVLELDDDVKVSGQVCTMENIRTSDGWSYTQPFCYDIEDFFMPVYERKTIEKFTVVNCEEGVNCEGTCDANICNLETVITVTEPSEPVEYSSWKPVKGECQLVTLLGTKYFDSKEECEDNLVLVQENLTTWQKFMEWFKKLL